jgi:hypothetical protein
MPAKWFHSGTIHSRVYRFHNGNRLEFAVFPRGAGRDYYRAVSILEVIARLSFRQAKPQPWGAHEYTVRSPENEESYVALFEAIQRDGVFERWRGRQKKYLYPGDGRKYWAMTTAVYQSRVINRMLVADDLARLRAEGQADCRNELNPLKSHKKKFRPDPGETQKAAVRAGRGSCSPRQ